MRLASLLLVTSLGGCVGLNDTLYDREGDKVDLAYILFNPLCVLVCNSNLSSAGSKVSSVGENAAGTLSQTQSTALQQGSN